MIYESTNVSQWSYNFGACGGSFKTQNGILTSPSYPGNYPDNVECTYTISQALGTVIMLKFLSLDTEKSSSSDKCYDYLEIRDGMSDTSPLLMDKLCGSEIPTPIESNKNTLWVK